MILQSELTRPSGDSEIETVFVRNGSTGVSAERKYAFTKVKDRRGREVDGLWERNGRYYYQLSILGKGCRRIPLRDANDEPVKTVDDAKEAIHELRKQKRAGALPTPRHAPPFDDFVDRYLDWIETTHAKKPKTVTSEKSILGMWKRLLGSVPLNQITAARVNDCVLRRRQGGVGNRTINLDVLVLSNCLKFAKREGLLPGKLPTEGWERLSYRAPKRSLVSKQDLERFCSLALAKGPDGKPKYRNGEMLVDAVKFMSCCGARVTSALATRWSDVDWPQRQLHLRETKYDNKIVVDFNPELETLLQDMHTRRQPDSDCLFPGTRVEGNVGSLRKTFGLVRVEAGLPRLGFHDLRHYFISWCVMSGIDYMTIAKWVGHSDGGMLIGKVYGHLNNEHAQRAAQKVTLGGSVEQGRPANPLAGIDPAKLQELLQLVAQIQSPPMPGTSGQ